MNLPLIDAAEFFLNLKQAAGEILPAVEEHADEGGLLQALSEAAKSKLGLAIAYRVYSESLRDPSNSAIGEHFKEHSEDCLNDVDFFVRRSSVMSGGASLEGVESPPASGDLTEILQVLSKMEEANLQLMSELVVLLEGNPSKYEVEAMMAKDQHHLDDLTQHMPVAPELPSVEEAAPAAAPPGVIGPAKLGAKKGLERVKEVFTGSRAKRLWDGAARAMYRTSMRGPDDPGVGRGIARATMLGVGAVKERAKQVGAIGGTAAGVVGAGVGAKKLLSKKDDGKEKTSELGAAAMGQHSPVAPPAPLNGAAAGQHPKLAQRTYDMGGSKRDGKAYSMHTTPDDYELSQLIISKMDGDLRGVRGKAKNEGMLVGSGLGAVKGLKAGKGWGGGEVIRTGGGGGTVIGTFGSGGKMPKGMGADIRENQGMIRDELRGQGIKLGDWSGSLSKVMGQRGITHAGQMVGQWGRGAAMKQLGGAGAVLGAGVGAVGGAVAGGPGHRLSGALGGAAVGGATGGAVGAAGGAAFHGSIVNSLNKANTVSDPFKHVGPAAAAAAMGPKLGADKSDSELAETGRQRAVANLASGFTSDKHTSGERHGTLAGRLGGAVVGAGAGALASKGATLPVRLAAGMGGAVIGGSMGGQIGKTIGSDHDAEKFWANHKEAGAGSSAAKWLAAHPAAVGGVAGSAIGAAGGAVAGGPEHRLSGAFGGAAIGGAAGATAGHVGGRLLRAAPSPTAPSLASGKPGTIMAGPLPDSHVVQDGLRGKSLTMLGGEEMASQYGRLPQSIKDTVESTDLARGIGTPDGIKIQPHNAAALMGHRGDFSTASQRRNARLAAEAAQAAATTKVSSLFRPSNMEEGRVITSHGDKEMAPVLGKRVMRNAKQVWDKAVKEAMGEEAPVEQYLQEEAAGRQAQEAAESDYLREQLQQTSQQLEQTQAQAQEQEAQVGEMQGTIQQLQGQQAEQAQAADAAVQTARQTAEAAMSQSMQRSAELMKQTQLAAGLQNAAATMKEQLMALSQTPVPPATVGEAGELDAAAQQQVGQDQAMEEQAAMEEEAQMAAAQGAPPAAAPAATPAAPKTAGMISGAGKVLRNAPGGVVGGVVGAASAAGLGALLRHKETAFLTDAVKKLEAKQQGGFLTGMMLAEARMVADRSAVMDQHPGKAALLNAVRGAGAGFALDKTIRHIS